MGNDKPICVIEDNVPIRKLFTTLLQKAGYTIADFPDGKSFIEWAQKNETQAIIMDILLPDINGTELIKMVKEIPSHSNVPIIAITGFATAHDREKFLNLGFSAYIPKPVNVASFVNDVKAVIE